MSRRKTHWLSTMDESLIPGAYEDRTGSPESKKPKTRGTDTRYGDEERRLENIVFGGDNLTSFDLVS